MASRTIRPDSGGARRDVALGGSSFAYWNARPGAEGYARSDADATARPGAPIPIRRGCNANKSWPGWTPSTGARERGRIRIRGRFPKRRARTGERWMKPFALDRAGLRVRTCLARLIAEKRGVRNRTNLPRLTHARIWSWAKKHHQRTGRWPTGESGPVVDAPGETWKGIDVVLRHGCRGFPVGHSLARLLAAKRGVKPRTGVRPRC